MVKDETLGSLMLVIVDIDESYVNVWEAMPGVGKGVLCRLGAGEPVLELGQHATLRFAKVMTRAGVGWVVRRRLKRVA